MIRNNNEELNMEHDHQQVYNIGIDDDSYVNNVSVLSIDKKIVVIDFPYIRHKDREDGNNIPIFR